MNRQVVLIDSGGYNIGSVKAALQRLGVNAELSTDPDRISAASHVILPGVGAAGPAMQKLRALQLDQLIPSLQQPVLGICLGMQLMYQHAEEADTSCLGIFSGTVKRMPAQVGIRIPHMGWNQLEWQIASPASSALAKAMPAPAWMYFVHSFAAPVTAQTLATASHGGAFTAIARHRNFLAAQFHPERSALAGQALLSYFLRAY